MDTLISYHFGEERFRRHYPKKVVKEHFTKYIIPLEYTSATWEEAKVHYGAKKYNEVISKRQGKPIGRITDEERAHEEAKKKEEEETIVKLYAICTSMQLGST